MKNIIGIVIGVGIIAALVFVGLQFNQDDTETEITVVEQIKKVAKLQTIEVRAATTLKKSKKDWAGAKKYTVYFAEGTVAASIDLEKMSIELDKEKNEVLIKLPKNVVVANATHDNFKIVCTHGSLTAPNFTDAERSKHTNEAFSIIKTKAKDLGIEAMALKQAKDYLTTFIGALGYVVVFK